jgi:hypothetical protein
VAPNSGERIKKAREKKSGTMKGSIPQSKFEAEMEKGSEEWNPKKYARRTDLGGRWSAQQEVCLALPPLPQIFESQVLYSSLLYFPFLNQLLNFSPIENLFFVH